MKQTQTKLFDFSDVGLDFCAGSKNLFPDRFKRMLTLGYNLQTVASVSVAGNQVTFTYGGTHGYVADRVLKVESGVLAGINGGEFWIDSVTSNTVTLTIDDAPVSIAGAFTTKIASLGWELVFEELYIHVYKFKALDESDLYLRICFQNNLSAQHYISPCIGKSFDPVTGFILDSDSLLTTQSITTPSLDFYWLYSAWTGKTENSLNYTSGFQWFGKGIVVGSKYHFVSLHQSSNTNGVQRLCAIFPFSNNINIDKYVLIGESSQVVTGAVAMIENARAYCGNKRIAFTYEANYTISYPIAQASYLPSNIDTFNTTMCTPILVYEYTTRQFIGIACGAYTACYANTNAPLLAHQQQPNKTKDIDLNNIIFAQPFGVNAWWAVPVEEIKIAT